jgi:hypothetical protein
VRASPTRGADHDRGVPLLVAHRGRLPTGAEAPAHGVQLLLAAGLQELLALGHGDWLSLSLLGGLTSPCGRRRVLSCRASGGVLRNGRGNALGERESSAKQRRRRRRRALNKGLLFGICAFRMQLKYFSSTTRLSHHIPPAHLLFKMALSMSTQMFTARAVRPAARASSEDKVRSGAHYNHLFYPHKKNPFDRCLKTKSNDSLFLMPPSLCPPPSSLLLPTNARPPPRPRSAAAWHPPPPPPRSARPWRSAGPYPPWWGYAL